MGSIRLNFTISEMQTKRNTFTNLPSKEFAELVQSMKESSPDNNGELEVSFENNTTF